MFQKLLRLFRPRQSDTAVHDLLESAAAQRAVFRIEIGEGSGQRRYFIASEINPGRIELEPRGLRLDGMHHWKGQRFAFRFILCSRDCGRTQLFEFTSRVASIDARRDRLCLDLPDAVKSLERRQNVRISLQMRHMPRIGVWPVSGGSSDKSSSPRIMSRPILDLSPEHSGIGLTIRNLSSGGIRLSFKKTDFAASEMHLEVGKRLLVELCFSGKAFPTRHLFRIIACVRNVVPCQGGRVEVGVQFLALHQQGQKPAWKSVEKGGVDAIGRLVHQFQVDYYKEIKRRLDRLPVGASGRTSHGS